MSLECHTTFPGLFSPLSRQAVNSEYAAIYENCTYICHIFWFLSSCMNKKCSVFEVRTKEEAFKGFHLGFCEIKTSVFASFHDHHFK